jgi:hypothetical protein
VATGVLDRPKITTLTYSTHATSDEVPGIRYALGGEDVRLLDSYVGPS